MSEERRRSPRINKPFSVLYRKTKRTYLDWDQTYVQNISARGILITTKELFKPDTSITIKIKFPFAPFQWYQFNARVIESFRVGIKAGVYFTRLEFVGLKEDVGKLIETYNEWFLSQGKGGNEK